MRQKFKRDSVEILTYSSMTYTHLKGPIPSCAFAIAFYSLIITNSFVFFFLIGLRSFPDVTKNVTVCLKCKILRRRFEILMGNM